MAGQYFKNTVWHFHTQTFKTQQKQVTLSFTSTKFPYHDKLNSLYCQHPQELFHYACIPE